MSFKDIGLRIQIAREEKGLSQEQLARALGCSQSALSNYEKGKRRLYLSQMEKLSEILEKPLEYFIESLSTERSSNNSNSLNGKEEIIVLLDKLSNEQLTEVKQYIEFIIWKQGGGGQGEF